MPWVAAVARWVLGGVFLVAGALKLPDPDAAVRAVRAYRLLPEPLVASVAFGLPVLEIAVGLALVAGVFVRTAAVAAAALLVVFLAGVGSAWVRGLQIDCGCFSDGGRLAAGKEAAYGVDILRDLGFLALSGFLVWRPRTRFSVDGLLMGDTR